MAYIEMPVGGTFAPALPTNCGDTPRELPIHHSETHIFFAYTVKVDGKTGAIRSQVPFYIYIYIYIYIYMRLCIYMGMQFTD
jgi:hypothetical protein